ncbi:hypothetical protein Syun_015067 [Stephania yunnanensis]|uniref:NAC domain-containing protein n=1 Tax=Stephania yunnanensis TaxID=152371 RepID=A0AAP0JMS9_9MAGN
MASSLLVSNSLSSSVVLPRGYVFAPTDSELFCHFLLSKIQNPDVKFEEIHDLDDIYKYTPEILANTFKDYSPVQNLPKDWQSFKKQIINRNWSSSDVGDEGGLEDYIMPQIPYYEDVNHGWSRYNQSCEEAMPPLMIINQDHPSAVPFIATDDNDCGNSSNFGLSNIEPHHADPEEAGAIIQDYQEKYQCDFNTDHPDVVAPPNVESTEVLEEEGLDWLRDFPKFQPADLEFSDWEADAWGNEFAPV